MKIYTKTTLRYILDFKAEYRTSPSDQVLGVDAVAEPVPRYGILVAEFKFDLTELSRWGTGVADIYNAFPCSPRNTSACRAATHAQPAPQERNFDHSGTQMRAGRPERSNTALTATGPQNKHKWKTTGSAASPTAAQKTGIQPTPNRIGGPGQ